MGYAIILIGLFLASVTGVFIHSVLYLTYFESYVLGLLVWIVFNQLVNFLAEEDKK